MMEEKPSYKTKLKDINTFIFDVDGVLTDGNVILSSSGEMVRTMSTRDGYAISQAIKKGFNVCIISGGNSDMVRKRLEYLGVKHIHLGVKDKLDVFEDYLIMQQIKAEQVLYMGDDLPDYEVMSRVGIAAAPNDAAPEILSIANYVSHKKGGEGCVRDVIEQVLKIKDCWFE
jgi:3-deoxy-D-manno-octulosonate 8-phosphate phosphatase (KDO 8-P phosphatase)